MNLRNQKRRAGSAKASFAQQQKRAGLLVTKELDTALAECKALVERIAKDCRAKNRCFRDVEFDLENDKERCLFGLSKEDRKFAPSDVQRVTKIFEKPSFFIDGAESNDIVQGRLGDCWFLSALATMSTAKGLIEKFCVARDEKVGVYGWIFFRDSSWVTVIIDDLLFTSIPKFEELNSEEQALYHRDKNFYNSSARKGGKSLYFARSGTENETWVPLIEKAFAKLHGDYASIVAGYSSEAIEDLTGGVSTFIPTKDILDVDLFWKEELLLATKDRLFGCGFDTLDTVRSGREEVFVNGLIGGHAYSVLRAVEYRGKRFVVLRNPWGDSEWTGRWSDGAKEWTKEWLPALEKLQHDFGDDGEFVMEYSDFLANWDLIERTLLFDDSWAMSSQWLQVTARPPHSAWSYGDISFTISIPAPTKAVLVLSKLDERYFQDISGNSCWTFDFVLFRKGSKEIVAESNAGRFWSRSVNQEVRLEKGEYVVHVRLDREVNTEVEVYHAGNTNQRKLARVQTERAKSLSIASNFKPSAVLDHLPIPLDVLAGQDLAEVDAKAGEKEKQEAALKTAATPGNPQRAAGDAKVGVPPRGPNVTESMTVKNFKSRRDAMEREATLMPRPTVVPPSPVGAESGNFSEDESAGGEDAEANLDDVASSLADEDLGLDDARSFVEPPSDVSDDGDSEYRREGSVQGPPSQGSVRGEVNPPPPEAPVDEGYDNDTCVLGLRVYTNKASPALIGGQLRHGTRATLAGLGSSVL
ncbi:cysteine proteinase [Mycena rebaudengoi]|nr:cysteine proteinase [Mycena rebaudengoi]